MPTRAIDLPGSTVTIRTKASGLFAKLAHDLELEARHFEGNIHLDGEAWQAELSFPVANLHVVGVVRKGGVDRSVLSPGDVAEIERKLREEVLRGARVVVRGAGAHEKGELHVVAPRGEQRIHVVLASEARPDGETVVTMRTSLSLARLGIDEVKGPLGAFKVNDEILVAARLVLQR